MSLTRYWPLLLILSALMPSGGMPVSAQQVMVVGHFGELPPDQSWNRLKDGSVFHHEVDLIAAHRTFPIGTRLRLTNHKEPQRKVEVTVLDRGPFIPGRDLDVSTAAARQLGIIEVGVAKVNVEVIHMPH